VAVQGLPPAAAASTAMVGRTNSCSSTRGAGPVRVPRRNVGRFVVFNPGMPLRRSSIVIGALLAALVAAAPASARIIEVGDMPETVTPTCPDTPCVAVSRTTGYQAKAAGRWGAYRVPRDGRIVAWTISLGAPDDSQRAFFDSRFGKASAGLTILRRGRHLYHRVIGQSPVQQLEPYFGQEVQFPLAESIPVRRGNIVALTVPTWAPALTSVLDDGSGWRASRTPKRRCGKVERQTAQTRMRQRTQYRCMYLARLTYSATLITTPEPNPPDETQNR
jgi:hypothetical protein